MFDQLKAMGAIADLVKNQDKLRAAGERLRTEMAAARFRGEAAGGIARAVVTGELRVESIEIAPALAAGLGSADVRQREMAQRVIVEALNEAMAAARGGLQRTVEREAGALGLKGLASKLGDLLPGGPA